MLFNLGKDDNNFSTVVMTVLLASDLCTSRNIVTVLVLFHLYTSKNDIAKLKQEGDVKVSDKVVFKTDVKDTDKVLNKSDTEKVNTASPTVVGISGLSTKRDTPFSSQDLGSITKIFKTKTDGEDKEGEVSIDFLRLDGEAIHGSDKVKIIEEKNRKKEDKNDKK